jgi:Anti-sigma-K factor rskA
MSAGDDDRISYLAGDAAESLSAHERAQLDELREMLRAPSTWTEPDPALEDRIVGAISAEAAAGGSEAASPEAVARRTRLPAFRFRLGLRRPGFALAAVATVAAVVVALVISNGKNTRASLHFAMAVSGTALAPRAHGSASLTKTGSGWRIELSATGLPHLANGRYYQAWLKNAAGILVPVGTFNDAAHVTLWSGVPVTQFRTLTVTQQLANGNPASSGKRVLIGRIRS